MNGALGLGLHCHKRAIKGRMARWFEEFMVWKNYSRTRFFEIDYFFCWQNSANLDRGWEQTRKTFFGIGPKGYAKASGARQRVPSGTESETMKEVSVLPPGSILWCQCTATGLIYAALDVYHNIVSTRKLEQKINPILDTVQDSCISSLAGDSWMVITLANKSVQPVQKGANRINKLFIFTSERGANWNVNKQLSSVPAARDWSPNQTSRPFRCGKWVIFAGPL